MNITKTLNDILIFIFKMAFSMRWISWIYSVLYLIYSKLEEHEINVRWLLVLDEINLNDKNPI